MKKLLVLTFSFALLTLTPIFTGAGLFAQFQPDVRLTPNDTVLSYTTHGSNAWCIASSGSVVHVVWFDFRHGNNNPEIYYKRSTDEGLSWGSDTRLTNNPFYSAEPSVAVSGSLVLVVWEDLRDGNYEIYYKRSTDGGVSWGLDTRLTNNTGTSQYPSVTVSGSVVHVVWYETRDGNGEIYYKGSVDGGISFGADTRLTNDPGTSYDPSVTVSGSFVHVVWYDNRNGVLNNEIYYKRSTDGGVSFGADTRLTNDPALSWYTSVSASGPNVHVVWQDQRDGPYEIYYKRSTDGGVSFGADTRLTNDPGSSEFPNVWVSGSNVHVVWNDSRASGNIEIYYKRSTDGGESWGADTRLTNAPGISRSSSVSASGTVVHVVWEDQREASYEIYYKRDPTGNPIGIINISTEIPNGFSLSQNYPNPFNPISKIKMQIAKLSDVKIIVFDALGRETEVLVNEQLRPGTYEVDFDGSKLSSGVYFYKLVTDGFAETKKMVLIK